MQKLALTKGRTSNGYTIIEMMFTVAVLGVVTVLAVPNFNDFIQRQRVKATGEVFTRMISEARSNALTRLVDVTMCWNVSNQAASVDGNTIPASSVLIFIPAIPAVGAVPAVPREDLALREFGDGQVLLQDTDDDDCVVFNSQARLDATTVSGASMQFGVCKDGSGETDSSVLITIGASGRPLTQANKGTVTALDCSG